MRRCRMQNDKSIIMGHDYMVINLLSKSKSMDSVALVDIQLSNWAKLGLGLVKGLLGKVSFSYSLICDLVV